MAIPKTHLFEASVSCHGAPLAAAGAVEGKVVLLGQGEGRFLVEKRGFIDMATTGKLHKVTELPLSRAEEESNRERRGNVRYSGPPRAQQNQRSSGGVGVEYRATEVRDMKLLSALRWQNGGMKAGEKDKIWRTFSPPS